MFAEKTWWWRSQRFALAVALAAGLFGWPAMVVAAQSGEDSEGVTRKRARALWANLRRKGDPGRRSQLAVVEAGDRMLGHFHVFIRADHQVDANHIARCVEGLNSNDYPVRKKCTETLLGMGPMALPHLRPVLLIVQEKDGPREVRVRLRHVVRTLSEQKAPSPYAIRYRRLVAVADELRSFQALRLANAIYEITPYDAIRTHCYRHAVQPLSMALYNGHLQEMIEALEAGKLTQARKAGREALRVADLTVTVSGEMARARLAYVKQLEKVRKRCDALRLSARKGEQKARAALVRLLVGELGDLSKARQWTGDADRNLAVLLRKQAESPSAEDLQQRAKAAEALLAKQGWSEFARVRLANWARNAWQARASKLPDGSEARDRAASRHRAMDARIMRLSLAAAVMGVSSTVQEFTEKELTDNLKRVSGLGGTDDQGVPYVTPTVWRQLSPIPNSGEPWGKATPPEGQFVKGAIDFEQTCRTGKKTVAWKTILKKDPPFNFVQPARRSYFYFYTEFRVEAEGLRPCLLGVDDSGTVWVNGKEVLSSERKPRSWKVDTCRGKVALRKGLNRVLVRLENLGGGAGMSLLIGSELSGDE